MKQLRITVEGKVYEVTVEVVGENPAASRASTTPVAAASAAPAAAAAASRPAAPPPAKHTVAGEAGDVPSPLSGKVVAIHAPVGTKVKAGDTVVTLEAMKMNTVVSAPADGTVTAVHVTAGEAVDEGQPLLTIA